MAKDDANNYGPGSPTLTPESMTGNPADLIPGFMRPNPTTGYPGAFNWAGMWNNPAVPGQSQTGGVRSTYPEDLYQSGLLPAPAASPVPAPGGPGPSAPAAPGTPQNDMLARLTGGVNDQGVLPANFFDLNQDISQRGGGVAKVMGPMTDDDKKRLRAQGMTDKQIAAHEKYLAGDDMKGRVWAFLEPTRQTQIQNKIDGLIEQWTSAVEKGLTGTGSNTVMKNASTGLANIMNAQSTAAKGPAEIANLEAQATAHKAQASLAPAQIQESMARASMYLRDPSDKERHSSAVSSMLNEHAKEKAAILKDDPLSMTDPVAAKKKWQPIFDQMDLDLKAKIDAYPYIMKQMHGGGGPLTISRFMALARASGLSEDQIKKEMDIGIQQGRITNG